MANISNLTSRQLEIRQQPKPIAGDSVEKVDMKQSSLLDIIIVGSGPVGLACSLEARNRGLEHVVLEKGGVNENMRRWPLYMTFFSTAEKVSIGDIPFPTLHHRPTREEGLTYYNAIVQQLGLPVKTYQPVEHIEPLGNGFQVNTPDASYLAKKVIIATGYYDQPNRLDIPGEELPHVSHYLDDIFRFAGTKVVVVGGSHSATDAALNLYRVGAKVTLVHRRAKLADKLKYWVKPDLENRIKEGSIQALMNTGLDRVTAKEVYLRNLNTNKVTTMPADFVLLMTGYRPDVELLSRAGINIKKDAVPEHDPTTFETNVGGLYVAGSITAGKHVSKIFIENGREHAKVIVEHLSQHL